MILNVFLDHTNLKDLYQYHPLNKSLDIQVCAAYKN